MNSNNPEMGADRSEDRTTYYYSSGQRYPLVKEPTMYAVKFAPGNRSDSTTISDRARQFLREESKSVEFIPNYGVQVYRVVPGRTASEASARVQETVDALNREKAVEFATVALRRTPQNSELMYATNRFVAQFKPHVTEQQIRDLNVKYQVTIVERLDYLDNGYLLEATSSEPGLSAIAIANLYYESGLTEFSHPDFIQQRHWKMPATATVTLPPGEVGTKAKARSTYLTEQWHLQIAKVVDAWNITRGSPEITIAILDDGIDLAHPEFSGKVTSQFDFGSNTADGNPKIPQDRHGTACAGVAAAAGMKAFGAAPNCKLMAVRTPDYMGISDEARMFRWVADQGADIISCSWGPQDGTGAVDPLPDITRIAIRYCIQQGRGGKGIPIFWAAGNGNESVSLDGYASNPDVMAIAASTSRETKAYYSDFGSEIFICAPSSGRKTDGEERIFTVDRLGSAGYNTGTSSLGDPAGDYTNDFGGTSSSAPLAAGIAGLILSVNPNLTVQQVKDILKQTADKIGSGYDANGHSNIFGYGRINALAAVKTAQPTDSNAVPSIQAPTAIARDAAPPVFHANPSPNTYYAVEVATQAELFNRATHQAARTASNFYASWQDTAFMSAPTYTLPTVVWERLKYGDRLYYRLWTSASSSSWANYAVTVADVAALSAPSIEIRDSQPASPPFIIGPQAIARAASPPVFQVNPSPNTYYAVEVAAQAELFNRVTHQAARTASNFYASWQDTAFMSDPSYTLPTVVWERLKSSDRLYYRLWTSASNRGWMNYATTISDTSASSAPGIQINQTSIGREVLERSSTPSVVTILGPFWLDLELQEGESVEVAFRPLGDSHSPNGLTTALHWTTNTQFEPRYLAMYKLGSVPRYQYQVRGIASPIKQWTGDWETITGTGPFTIHIPRPMEPGVAIRLERDISSSSLKREPIAPTIVGPETWDSGREDPPSFTILPGSNGCYAIEVATDSKLFNRAGSSGTRTPQNFFASWKSGLLQVTQDTTTFTLPLASWEKLRRSPRLYYRVLTVSSMRPDWPDYQVSTPDWMASQAPWVDLSEKTEERTIAMTIGQPYLSSQQTRRQDEQLWRT